MDGRKNNRGTKGNKGGRKPKALEQKIAETLSPLEGKALAALAAALDDNQGWAVKLFFEYLYGKPKPMDTSEDKDEETVITVNHIVSDPNTAN